jgi:hypothetical protein
VKVDPKICCSRCSPSSLDRAQRLLGFAAPIVQVAPLPEYEVAAFEAIAWKPRRPMKTRTGAAKIERYGAAVEAMSR